MRPLPAARRRRGGLRDPPRQRAGGERRASSGRSPAAAAATPSQPPARAARAARTSTTFAPRAARSPRRSPLAAAGCRRSARSSRRPTSRRSQPGWRSRPAVLHARRVPVGRERHERLGGADAAATPQGSRLLPRAGDRFLRAADDGRGEALPARVPAARWTASGGRGARLRCAGASQDILRRRTSPLIDRCDPADMKTTLAAALSARALALPVAQATAATRATSKTVAKKTVTRKVTGARPRRAAGAPCR